MVSINNNIYDAAVAKEVRRSFFDGAGQQ